MRQRVAKVVLVVSQPIAIFNESPIVYHQTV